MSLRGSEAAEAIYYHGDHLGSSNVITDENGAQVARYEYSPYGSLAVQEPLTDNRSPNYLFTGKELDSTGLYFYGARYYDPEIGRFVSADTIVQAPYDPQSLNRYAYCRNNPLKYTDPSGHFFFLAVLAYVAICAAIGAVVNVAIAGATGGITSWTSFWSAMGSGAVAGAVAGIGSFIPGAGTILGGVLIGVVAGGAAGAVGSSISGAFSWGAVGIGAAFGGVLGGVGNSSVGRAIGGAVGKGIGKLPFGQHIQNFGRSISDKMSGLYQAAKGTGSSATSSLNTNKAEEQWDRIVVKRGVDPDSYRYVGAEEAAKIAEISNVPNVSKSGVSKNVFYTPEELLTSAFQAQSTYNLKDIPTHRIGLDTSKTTNIYGGNVDGGSGVELVTQEQIPVVDIQKLGK